MLKAILEPLHAGMSSPHLLRCPDGHMRSAIFAIGPFIADYPEQVDLAAIVQGWCPKSVFTRLVVSQSTDASCRCHASPAELAHGGIMRSREADEALYQRFQDDRDILWSVFGIVGQVKVCPFRFLVCINLQVAAVYNVIPQCRYPRAPHTGPPTSAHQGSVQRSSGPVDGGLGRAPS
jgi:hypothetical protein